MIREAVIIPALRSFFTFALLSVFIIAVFIIAGIEHPFAWGFGIASVFAIGYWFHFLAVEDDIRAREKKRMDVHHNLETVAIMTVDGNEGFFLQIPGGKEQWQSICKKLIRNNMRFTAATLVSKDLGRKRFEALRTDMITKGLLRWVNPHAPNQGVALTRAGLDVVCRYAR